MSDINKVTHLRAKATTPKNTNKSSPRASNPEEHTHLTSLQKRSVVQSGPLDLKVFIDKVKTPDTLLEVSPKSLLESALKDLQSLTKANLDTAVIAEAVKKNDLRPIAQSFNGCGWYSLWLL